MKRLLIVVNFQNDFVNGSLGFDQAKELEKPIVELIKEYQKNNDEVVYTMDTHPQNYLNTYEGKHLPVTHCVENTEGWQLYGQVKDLLKNARCFIKPTFPSLELAVGLVSHICVLSNAIMAKAALPQTPIRIMMNATSSIDLETHKKSIDVMKSMQIEVIE